MCTDFVRLHFSVFFGILFRLTHVKQTEDNGYKTDMENDRIFQEEQEHLTKLHRQISKMKEQLESELSAINRKAAEEKQQQSEDLRLNFNNDEDIQETLIEFEVMSQAVAQLNIESQSTTAKLNSVKQLLPRPYFARIDVEFDEDEDAETFYIGSTALSDSAHDQLIVDWRSPIAEVYYNHENGSTSYEVEGRRIPVNLKLRRQFDLERDVLHSYFDTKVALEDPMLIRSLSRRHTDKMQAITETIQKEQNAVIRHPDVPVLLINGIAGSGKTSVLLQRIAYLFYRQRKTLRPEQVYLITLNPVFQQYIDHVLPEMGEANPNTLTWSEFLTNLGVRNRGEADLTDAASLRIIDEKLPGLKLTADDFRHIYQKTTKVVTKKQTAQVIRQHDNIETGVRLIQIVVDELEELALKNAADIEKRRAQEHSDDEEAPAVGNMKQIESQYGGAIQAIRNYKWLNIEKIGERLLGTTQLTPAQYLYLELSLTGMCDRNARYVMVDEVQDYSEAQLMILTKYFKNARFMLLGDEFQSIHEDGASFADIHQLFEHAGKPVTELALLTSYRSSPEITERFTALLPEDLKIQTSSVQREGIQPVIKEVKNHQEYITELKQAVQNAQSEEGLTAVICRDWTGINRLRQLLKEETPHVVRTYEALPEQGVILLELKLAKGLEFDHVIVADGTKQNYPDNTVSRHRLYTAMSRATSHLTVLSDGEMTTLLKA